MASAPNPGLLYGASINSIVFTLGYKVLRKGLTVAGVMHAWFLGTSVYAAFGYGGHLLVCLYFIFGTLVRSATRACFAHGDGFLGGCIGGRCPPA